MALLNWLIDVDRSVDLALSLYYQHNVCLVVMPELIGSHKPASGLTCGINKDSDTGNEQGDYREK